MDVPWQKLEIGYDLFIKLTPNASKTGILGTTFDGNNRCFLKVAVTAIPENNKANQMLVTFLSKTLHIPKSLISLKAGATNTWKILTIPEITAKKLGSLIL